MIIIVNRGDFAITQIDARTCLADSTLTDWISASWAGTPYHDLARDLIADLDAPMSAFTENNVLAPTEPGLRSTASPLPRSCWRLLTPSSAGPTVGASAGSIRRVELRRLRTAHHGTAPIRTTPQDYPRVLIASLCDRPPTHFRWARMASPRSYSVAITGRVASRDRPRATWSPAGLETGE